MGRKKSKLIRLDRESVIPITKPKLIETLKKLIESDSDKKEFLTFCKRVEYTVRAWYMIKTEDMMQLYALFDPVHGASKLEQQNLSGDDVDKLEQKFLSYLFQMMDKSNFKVVTDQEIAVALAGKYRLNLPIKVNEAKIDRTLLSRYFGENPHENLPYFAEQYVIFWRGIGMDQMTAYFINAKVDTMLSRFYHGLLKYSGLRLCFKKKKKHSTLNPKKEDEENQSDSDQDDLIVERVLIENMSLSPISLIRKTTIQEPTFESIIIVYRLADVEDSSNNRGIFVKHFKNIPMADMEIVLPEKLNPGLTPLDFVKFFGSALVGLVTVITQVMKSKADIKVIAAVGCAVIGYIAKTYFTFQSNFTAYQNLITRSMYDKQLDSGRGTLLHLCDNVIQQEVKEIIVAFFMLSQQGKLSMLELDRMCEEMMEKEFNERLNFDVHDALQKLEKLGIVSQDAKGRYTGVGMQRANEMIGTTTEELVLQAEETSPPNST